MPFSFTVDQASPAEAKAKLQEQANAVRLGPEQADRNMEPALTGASVFLDLLPAQSQVSIEVVGKRTGKVAITLTMAPGVQVKTSPAPTVKALSKAKVGRTT